MFYIMYMYIFITQKYVVKNKKAIIVLAKKIEQFF